jgi:hypothetical protein
MNLEQRVEAAGARREMAERYAELVEAAGYLDGTIELTPYDCLILANKIMKDVVVYKFAWENKRTIWGAVCDLDYVASLKALGDEGRAALRARLNFTPVPIIRGGPER